MTYNGIETMPMPRRFCNGWWRLEKKS